MKLHDERHTLRGQSDAELQDELRKARASLFKLRFQYAGKQLTDTDGIRRSRKRVARILTVLAAREQKR